MIYCKHISLVPLLAAGLLAGCTGSDSSSPALTGALSVSGSLTTTNGSASNVEEFVNTMSVNLADYKVSCATSTTPVRTGTSAVAADGSFSVSIEGGENQPLSCFLVDAEDVKVADFLISDSSKKDLNGRPETSNSATFKSNASLGTIDFDPQAGEVTIPAANIASTISTEKPAAANVFDPTGSWKIGAIDFTPPKGTLPPCSGDSCKGPPEGMDLYFKLWKGVTTSDSSDVFGLQLWEGQAKYTACGEKIGLTSAIKSDLGVDFSANGSADGVFSFANSVTFNDEILNASSSPTLIGTGAGKWKMSTATARYNLQPACGPRDIVAGATTYVNAWVCGPDNSNNYQAQLGGGCVVTSTNAPVDVRDWSGITSCSSESNTSGVRSNTCTGTATVNGTPNVAVSCSNKWAIVNSSYVVQSSGSFNFNDLATISSGTLCSAIDVSAPNAELKKIAQLQCYANYYHMSGMRNASACLPKVDLDWSATTAEAFEKVDEIRPEGLIFFEKFNPYRDGSGGAMTTREEHYEGVQVGSSWTNCRVVETGGLTIKKITDTKMLAVYQSSTITTSVNKPACLGKFNGARETFMFYLTKN